ncbi:MAG TPA: DUF72 domain-containing protein, partial [Steroidobacter sp.]|nr:DUF72 domain-containing protein [Steroidobacter sp.]
MASQRRIVANCGGPTEPAIPAPIAGLVRYHPAARFQEQAMPKIRIGVSGWRYAPWRGVFYPPGLPQRLELWHASRVLPTIEINGSFYSLQRPEYYRRWHEETPSGFMFAVKGPRFITHMKRLREIETPLANFFASGVFELREKFGPILWQFPPNFRYDHDKVE